jgi:hypothetical protein
MNWGVIMHVAMALYLLAIYIWVQHAMIVMTRIRNDQREMYKDITELQRRLNIKEQSDERTRLH